MADNEKQIIDWQPNPDLPGGAPLGRHLWHDNNNRLWRALGAVRPIPTTSPVTRPWYTRQVYFQEGSSCTAQAATGVAFATSPYTARHTKTSKKSYDTEAERHALYLEAQRNDPWDGGEPDYYGSSTDAPYRVLRDRGEIKAWRWLFGVEEIWHWLEFYGPCSIGTNWFENMDYPDSKGLVRATGGLRGGHAYRLIYHDLKKQMTLAVNSWSRQWGLNGRFWILDHDLRELIDFQQGEAVTVEMPA
ncbi:MAG TPA: hypothetical protein VJ742_12415 [Nitrososphaera sp.]|nr:hypothetical protein [Nitrososphaera sp.]